MNGKKVKHSSRQVVEGYPSDYEGILRDKRRCSDGFTEDAHLNEARIVFKGRSDSKPSVLRATNSVGGWVGRDDLLGSSKRAELIGKALGFSVVLTRGNIPYGESFEDVCDEFVAADSPGEHPSVLGTYTSNPRWGTIEEDLLDQMGEPMTETQDELDMMDQMPGTATQSSTVDVGAFGVVSSAATHVRTVGRKILDTTARKGVSWASDQGNLSSHSVRRSSTNMEVDALSRRSSGYMEFDASLTGSTAYYTSAGSSISLPLFDNINPLSSAERAALPVATFETERVRYRDIIDPDDEIEYVRGGTEYRGPFPRHDHRRRVYSEVKGAKKPKDYLSGRTPVAIASIMCKGNKGAAVPIYRQADVDSSDSDGLMPELGLLSDDSDDSLNSEDVPDLVLDSGSDLSSDEQQPAQYEYISVTSGSESGSDDPDPSAGASLLVPTVSHVHRKKHKKPWGAPSRSSSGGVPEESKGMSVVDEAAEYADEGDDDSEEIDPVTTRLEVDRADRRARLAEKAKEFKDSTGMRVRPRKRVNVVTGLPCPPRVKRTSAEKRQVKVDREERRTADTQSRIDYYDTLPEDERRENLEREVYALDFEGQKNRRAWLTWKVTQSVQNFTKQGVSDKELDLSLEQRIDNLCLKAFEKGDNKMCETDAVVYGDNFVFPPAMVEADERAFAEAGNSLEELVAHRQAAIASRRMSLKSVDLVCTEGNPDRQLLEEIAEWGMDLMLPEDYQPNNPLPDGQTPCEKLSKSYTITRTAVDKMIYNNFYEKGLAIVLTEKTAVQHITSFSTAVARWATKAGKPQGRNIHDATAKAKGQTHVLNSKYSQAACKEKYGTIFNPTLESVVCMVFEFWEREKKINPKARWEDIELWKMDLAGAFTLLSFQAAMVRHVALALWGGLIVFFLCGVFGWTGTPGCFQVVNRTLMYEAAKLLRGLAQMFCDDVMGVCFSKDVSHDQQVLRWLIQTLFNDEGAVAEQKTERGRKLVILGYNVDLDTLVASIDDKNLYNALYFFMELKEHSVVHYKDMEKGASLASRYGTICVHMNPMVRVLYRELKGKHRGRRWHLSQQAKVAIWFFRAMLVATNVCGTEFCRPLWSMRKLETWLYIAEFDACLTGIGCVWYILTPYNVEIAVGAASWDISSMGFENKPQYQNTCEFMGAIFCLVGLVRYDSASKPFLLRGDSKSALSWAAKKRLRGNLATPAGFMFNYIWVTWQVLLSSCQHLAGELNNACDDLSRAYCERMDLFREEGIADAERPSAERRYSANMSDVGDRSACVDLETFKELCDPSQEWNTEEEFAEFWGRMVRWCEKVMGEPPEPWSPNPLDHA